MSKHPKCPACGGPIPNADHEGEYPGAISRRDNKTEICSDCGLAEAMHDFHSFLAQKATQAPNQEK